MNPQPKPVKRLRVPKQPKRRAYVGAKRAAAKAAGTVTPEEWRRIVCWSRWRCSYCQGDGANERMQQDHVVPIAKGGKHEASNLALACPKCNYEKGTNRREFHPTLPPHPFRKEHP